MFLRRLLRQSVQPIKNSHRCPPIRQFQGTLPPPGRPTLFRFALPVAVGVIASSCAFVAFAPLSRLDGSSSSDVRRSSGSRSKAATRTEEDRHNWMREELLQAIIDSPRGKNDDMLGLLAVLLVESYHQKPGDKMDIYMKRSFTRPASAKADFESVVWSIGATIVLYKEPKLNGLLKTRKNP